MNEVDGASRLEAWRLPIQGQAERTSGPPAAASSSPVQSTISSPSPVLYSQRGTLILTLQILTCPSHFASQSLRLQSSSYSVTSREQRLYGPLLLVILSLVSSRSDHRLESEAVDTTKRLLPRHCSAHSRHYDCLPRFDISYDLHCMTKLFQYLRRSDILTKRLSLKQLVPTLDVNTRTVVKHSRGTT